MLRRLHKHQFMKKPGIAPCFKIKRINAAAHYFNLYKTLPLSILISIYQYNEEKYSITRRRVFG